MIKDVVRTVGTRGLSVVLSFGASILTARVLGPEGRGAYYLALTLGMTLVQLGNLGLHASNTYLLAGAPSLHDRLLVNSVWTAILVGGGLALLGWFGPPLVGMDMHLPARTTLLGLLVAPTQLILLLSTNILIGSGRIAAYNVADVAQQLLVVGGFAALWLLRGASPDTFLAVTVTSFALPAIVIVMALRRRARAGWRFDTALFARGLRYGVRAFLTALFPYLIFRGGVLALGWWSDLKTIGQFSVALQLFEVMRIVPTAVSTVLFPSLVRASPVDRRRQTTLWSLAMLALMGAGALFTALLGDWFIRSVFGPGFEPAFAILLRMLPAAVAYGVHVVIAQYFAAEGVPDSILWAWAGGLALFAGAFLLFGRSGANGAALALSITYIGLLATFLGLFRGGRTPQPVAAS
jgi:O-antigen/teichoic acid export membrane protein